MADQDYVFDPGNNLESLGFSTAQVTAILQAISEAEPNPYRGMLIVDENQPAVNAGYAWQKRCLWLKPSTGAIARYNDTHAWVSIFAAITNISGTAITAGSLPLTALTGSGAVAFNLIRRNAANTAWEFVNATDIFAAGSLPTNRLQVTGIPSGAFRVMGTFAPDAWGPYTASDVASEFDIGSVAYIALSLPGSLTTRRQFLGAKSGDTQMVAAYIDPAADLVDNALSGVKLTTNTVPINKLVAGAEGYIATIVGGIPTWAEAGGGSGTTFEEDFVFATGAFDNAGSNANTDIALTLPANREWKDIEIFLYGSKTGTGGATLTLKWNTAPETGAVGVGTTTGCGRNTLALSGVMSVDGLHWSGVVPSTIKATNITFRIEIAVSGGIWALSLSRYELRARATANV